MTPGQDASAIAEQLVTPSLGEGGRRSNLGELGRSSNGKWQCFLPTTVRLMSRPNAGRFRVWIEVCSSGVFPCHPTAFFDPTALTSEYVGCVRASFRNAFGEDTVVLFLQGASGDLRPPFTSYDPRRVGGVPLLASLIPAFDPPFALPHRSDWERWADGLADGIVKMSLSGTMAKPSATWPCVRPKLVRARPRSVLDTDLELPDLEVTGLRLDQELTIIAVNAEVTSPLAAEARRLPGYGQRTVIATCMDECLGYVASDDEMFAGGYEGGSWLQAFGCEGSVSDEAPSAVLAMFAEVIRELGAP